MKSPLEWTLPNHKECGARLESILSVGDMGCKWCLYHSLGQVARGMLLASYITCQYLSVVLQALCSSSCSILCMWFPTVFKGGKASCDCTGENDGVKLCWPSVLPRDPFSWPRKPFCQTTQVQVINHGGMSTFTPCMTLDNTCPEMTILFRRDDCSCFSCGSPWSWCLSSSQQVN